MLCIVGSGFVLWTAYEKLVNDVYVYRHRLVVGVFFFTIGLNLFLMGLLAELVTRTYHESQSKPIYHVRERTNSRRAAACRGGRSRDMKVCLSCEARFDATRGSAPSVSSPVENAVVCSRRSSSPRSIITRAMRFGSLPRARSCYFWFTARKSLIFELVSQDVPRCAEPSRGRVRHGRRLARIHAEHPDVRLTGCRSAARRASGGSRRLPDATFIQADIRHVPYEEEFDIVCALDVIEHVDEDDVALGEIARAAKPGGGVVVRPTAHVALGRRGRADAATGALLEALASRAGRRGRLERVRVTSSFSFVLPLVYLSRLRSRTLSDGSDPYDALRIPHGQPTRSALLCAPSGR